MNIAKYIANESIIFNVVENLEIELKIVFITLKNTVDMFFFVFFKYFLIRKMLPDTWGAEFVSFLENMFILQIAQSVYYEKI